MSEKVLAFDEKFMLGFKDLPGFSNSNEDMAHLAFSFQFSNFEDRATVEIDETKKQIIPYVVIRKGDKVLAYQRSKKSGEGRLHNKWSVGIGGHINPIDETTNAKLNMIISNTIQRELLEELEWGETAFVHTVNGINALGLLYDDEDPVGRVHIGYVFTIDIPEDEEDYPKPREDTIADCQWFTVKEASKLMNLEGWSKIVLEAMENGPNPTPGN